MNQSKYGLSDEKSQEKFQKIMNMGGGSGTNYVIPAKKLGQAKK